MNSVEILNSVHERVTVKTVKTMNKLAVITWHIIFVGNADGAESIVCHWLNKRGYHFVLVRLRKLPQLTVVTDKPRTPGQVQINSRST